MREAIWPLSPRPTPLHHRPPPHPARGRPHYERDRRLTAGAPHGQAHPRVDSGDERSVGPGKIRLLELID